MVVNGLPIQLVGSALSGLNVESCVHSCQGSPCGAGICSPNLDTFSCQCPLGWGGESCSTPTPDSSPIPGSTPAPVLLLQTSLLYQVVLLLQTSLLYQVVLLLQTPLLNQVLLLLQTPLLYQVKLLLQTPLLYQVVLLLQTPILYQVK